LPWAHRSDTVAVVEELDKLLTDLARYAAEDGTQAPSTEFAALAIRQLFVRKEIRVRGEIEARREQAN